MAMLGSAPRRFYKNVAVIQTELGWGVTLDGKVLRSPARNALDLPSRALADAIAGEWDAQTEKIQPHSMPLMQFAATAVDRIGPARASIVADLAGYAGTDLICYRATEPATLVERESQTWEPLLDWLRRRYDVSLSVTSGIVAIPQPQASLDALARAVDGFGDFALAALATLVYAAGSLVIALAVAEGELTAEQAAHAAQLDELYQAERWGEDKEALERRVGQLAELVAARRFLDLLGQP
jgi:chaperone required for assembly of F1-ATPase